MHRVPLKNWNFTKESRTEPVTLPHCWNRAEEGKDYYRGCCLYECRLSHPLRSDRVYYLEFEGANSVARLEVNGKPAGEHRGGYSTFRFNITALREGENDLIQVYVDNSHREDVYPLMADFAFMGGLYRPVWLIETGEARFDLDDGGSDGVYVRQEELSRELVRFRVDGGITLPSAPADYSCRCEVISPEGETVLGDEQAVTGERVIFSFALENPRLWEGLNSPALYEVRLFLRQGDQERDRRTVRTGFRLPQTDPARGFLLNRSSYPLRGVSRHQDRAGVGWALTEEHFREDLALIREMGANAIRLAHYQHSREFYDLCDREGFVVWGEIPYISRTSREDKKGTNALSQLEELIKQNYNRPSLCFWGLQNEITIGGKKEWARKITGKLHRKAKKLDPIRLTGQSQVGHYSDEGSLNGVSDCLGYNKYFGWYYGECSQMDEWLTQFARNHPTVPLGITEYGAEGLTRYHNDAPRREDYSEEYHALYHEETLKIFNRHPRLWGTFVWNMFDFSSPIRDEGGVLGMNNKGLVSYDRKTRKDAFYWYKAHWNDEPMVHITGKKYLKRRGKTMEVKVYTNQATVVLEVNGKTWDEALVKDRTALFSQVPLKRRGITMLRVRGIGVTGREECIDRAGFHRVRRGEPSYVCPEKDPFHFLKNWFEGEPDEEIPPLEFPEGFLSIRDKIRVIIKYPRGEEVLRKYAGPLYDHPMFPMAKGFSPEKLTELRPGTVPDSFMARLNGELTQIPRKSAH
ncbi:MAG: glycoside hydrolase family 2 TIM barrel-domain containing protein [Spirochaetales bacterium]|nr:glycoside hydrolase family 2 TIM barrel-domain containing protein [Spirochaetales bacterium]